MSNEELIAFLKKNWIGAICFAVSVAAFGWWYYRSGDVPAKDQDLQQKSVEAQRYALNLNNSTQLQDQFDILVAANKEVAARLVSKDIGKNIQYFYKLENESGAKLVTDPRQAPAAGPAKGAVKGSYQPVQFTVAVQGDLSQVLGFLRRLESGAHYGRVLGATCTVPQERSLPLSLALSLELLGLP